MIVNKREIPSLSNYLALLSAGKDKHGRLALSLHRLRLGAAGLVLEQASKAARQIPGALVV